MLKVKLLILSLLIGVLSFGQTYIPVQGNKYYKGFSKFAKKVTVEDTLRIGAKGIKYADGTIGTTGFTSGDTVQLNTLVPMLEDSTVTYVTPYQLSTSSVNAVSRDSLYIGTDGYVHFVKDGYDVRLAVKDSTSTASALLTGILAYWNMDEESGNILDQCEDNYDGTVTGATQHVAGKVGYACDFEKDSTDYAGFGTTLGSIFGTSDISVSCWVQMESQVGYTSPIGNWNGENYWMFFFDTKPQLALNFGSGNNYTEANSAINTGEWYHVVATIDRQGYTKLYVNGTLQTDSDDISASSAVNLNTTNLLNIGTAGDNYSNFTFDGKIDEVGIWLRVLTQADVTELYNSGTGITYPF